jgi:bifunctional DNase/RNase
MADPSCPSQAIAIAVKVEAPVNFGHFQKVHH